MDWVKFTLNLNIVNTVPGVHPIFLWHKNILYNVSVNGEQHYFYALYYYLRLITKQLPYCLQLLYCKK